MTQTCPVTITWQRGPTFSVVLVAAGEWIAAPMSATGQQDVFETPGMGNVEAYFRALGGAVLDLQFELEDDQASTATAVEKHLDMQAAWFGLDGRVGTLTIEPEDESWSAVFHPCVLRDLTPSLPSGTGAPTLRRKLRFAAAPPTYTEP